MSWASPPESARLPSFESDDEKKRLRALAHPLRLRLLSLLATPMSATEVAREMGIAHSAASYHLHLLESAGYADVVEDPGGPGRGHTQRRYRSDPNQTIRVGDGEGRVAVVTAQLADLRRRMLAPAMKRQTADAELWVDRSVWEEAGALARRLSDLVHGAAQAPRTPGTVHASMTVMMLTLSDFENESEQG